jgi:hypothetical protein
MTPSAYPLAWPAGFPRAKWAESGKFKTALPAAIKNVQSSLNLFAKDSGKTLQSVVISSNCTLGVDNPSDPGVAVYFTWDGLSVCIPVDRYKSVASNLQAIHHIIEARRVELRHGTLALVRATFQGFVALPAPKSCWDILGIAPGSSKEQIETAYRSLARKAHPDTGGSDAAMAELNDAKGRALKEIP